MALLLCVSSYGKSPFMDHIASEPTCKAQSEFVVDQAFRMAGVTFFSFPLSPSRFLPFFVPHPVCVCEHVCVGFSLSRPGSPVGWCVCLPQHPPFCLCSRLSLSLSPPPSLPFFFVRCCEVHTESWKAVSIPCSANSQCLLFPCTRMRAAYDMLTLF